MTWRIHPLLLSYDLPSRRTITLATILAALALLLAAMALPVAAQGQVPAGATEQVTETGTETASEAPTPPLRITSIAISPEKPAADTLCTLRVTLRNDGTATASALRFDVSVGGTPLDVYERQVFMDAVAPGAETEVALFNFWTSETGRPAPKDGSLTVSVTLREARWTKIESEGDTPETTVETWTLGEMIAPLPEGTRTTLKLVGSGP